MEPNVTILDSNDTKRYFTYFHVILLDQQTTKALYIKLNIVAISSNRGAFMCSECVFVAIQCARATLTAMARPASPCSVS